jgi:TPR repeat protein
LPLPAAPFEFHSANFYTLFGRMLPARIAVEFEGSNDAGRTWRTYEFRYQPQREDTIPPFLAPRYARFEATLQVEANRAEPSPLFAHVGARLLKRSPEVLAQFRRDPFPDKPPTLMHFPAYQMSFTNLATWRTTGRFWDKVFSMPHFQTLLLYLDERGEVAAATSALDQHRALAIHGNPSSQYELGVAYARGEQVPRDLVEAAKWYRLAADQGIAAAQGRLGSLLISGEGVPRDPAEAARRFRQAAEQGNAYAALNLALLHARGEGVPRDEFEALVWFTVAAALGDPDAAQNQLIAARRLGSELTARAEERAQAIRTALEAKRK